MPLEKNMKYSYSIRYVLTLLFFHRDSFDIKMATMFDTRCKTKQQYNVIEKYIVCWRIYSWSPMIFCCNEVAIKRVRHGCSEKKYHRSIFYDWNIMVLFNILRWQHLSIKMLNFSKGTRFFSLKIYFFTFLQLQKICISCRNTNFSIIITIINKRTAPWIWLSPFLARSTANLNPVLLLDRKPYQG